MTSKGKIFGLGFHKTGLTSLATALRILRFKTTKGIQPYKNFISDERSEQLLNEKDFDSFINYIKNYDAVVDFPWSTMYELLDEEFPNSKFVLTLRNEKSWVESMSYFNGRPKNYINKWVYGADPDALSSARLIQRHKQHVIEVKKYFENREEDLLIMNIEKGDGWDKLCPFLSLPELNMPFPHYNQRV